MKSFLAYVTLACLTATASAGCTIITPDSPDGSKPIIKPVPFPIVIHADAIPPPPPVQANLLYVINLSRSSANLNTQYAAIMGNLATYFQGVGLDIVNMGVISTYADQFGPRLLMGQKEGGPSASSSSLLLAGLLAQGADAGLTSYQSLLPIIGPMLGNIDSPDIPTVLQLLAASGSFDGDTPVSEAENVIEFGEGLNAFELPSSLGGIDRSALFDTPLDLFIVIYLQPLPRHCALSDVACQVNGRAPNDIFVDTNADGTASWLTFANGGMMPSRVVQAAIATPEGVSETDFETKCKAVNGFQSSDFDVTGPSPNAYFGPLMADLNAANPGTGQSADFCTLVGSMPNAAIQALGSSIAGVLH
jgi:hypothetical protein